MTVAQTAAAAIGGVAIASTLGAYALMVSAYWLGADAFVGGLALWVALRPLSPERLVDWAEGARPPLPAPLAPRPLL